MLCRLIMTNTEPGRLCSSHSGGTETMMLLYLIVARQSLISLCVFTWLKSLSWHGHGSPCGFTVAIRWACKVYLVSQWPSSEPGSPWRFTVSRCLGGPSGQKQHGIESKRLTGVVLSLGRSVDSPCTAMGGHADWDWPSTAFGRACGFTEPGMPRRFSVLA